MYLTKQCYYSGRPKYTNVANLIKVEIIFNHKCEHKCQTHVSIGLVSVSSFCTPLRSIETSSSPMFSIHSMFISLMRQCTVSLMTNYSSVHSVSRYVTLAVCACVRVCPASNWNLWV